MSSHCPEKRIVGHSSQRETLKRIVLSRRLPSALAFCGQPGTGKRLVAEEFCRSLLCEKYQEQVSTDFYGGCGLCRGCRLFSSGNHPDYHFLSCDEKDQASTESIRETLSLLSLKAYTGSTRLLVFDNAEQLSVQAANILLKTAEEPGANTCLIFISASQSKLPVTLMSRCQMIFFNPLSSHQVIEVLRTNQSPTIDEEPEDDESPDYSSPSLDELAVLADGSPGAAETLSRNPELWQQIKNKLPSAVAGDFQAGHELLGQLAKEKQDLVNTFSMMRILARQRMFAEKNRDLKLRWAVLLTNLLSATRLVQERNISGIYALNAAFLDLSSSASAAPFLRLTNAPILLDNLVV